MEGIIVATSQRGLDVSDETPVAEAYTHLRPTVLETLPARERGER